MKESMAYETKRLRSELRQAVGVIAELKTRISELEDTVSDALVMVPMYVHVPHVVYQRLRESAEELGIPAAELASLWLWRSIREF